MFRTLMQMLTPRPMSYTYTATQRFGETDAEFDIRYAKEERAYFAQFNITV